MLVYPAPNKSVPGLTRRHLGLTSTMDQRRHERYQLQKLLGSEGPENDLTKYEDLRTDGTCKWLPKRDKFRRWHEGDSRMYWLDANPGTGKSVLAAFIIDHFQRAGMDCSYHFFRHSDKIRSTLAHFLRSMAYQMASTNETCRNSILLALQDVQVEKDDYRTIWRRLFTGCIFKQHLDKPFYWFIDALDECKDYLELTTLLTKVDEGFPLKVFITSRFGPEKKHLGSQILQESVPREATMYDIRLYVQFNIDDFAIRGGTARQQLIDTILQKSAGCFLWVRLVVEELSKVHDSDDIQLVLNTISEGMRSLYKRTLDRLATAPYGKPLARAILVWTVCSTRPITMQELENALQLDYKPTFTNLRKSIDSLCGQLLYVDSDSRVQMIHESAKEFLLKDAAGSEFAIHKGDGNRRLAEACITYLADDEMKAPRGPKASISHVALTKRSPFAAYACSSWYHHVSAAQSDVDSVLNKLGKFLGSPNILTWIETVAQTGDLGHLIEAGKVLKTYLDRRAKHISLIGRDVQIVSSWSSDLIRIVAKFGQNLLLSPSSIYQLIPSFCPPDSAPHRQFGNQPRGISVTGPSADGWDDCLSCITYGSDRTSAVACDNNLFAVGLTSGKILIYHRATCQLVKQFKLGEAVKNMCFSPSSLLLACCGTTRVRIWNMLTGAESETILHDLDSPLLVLAISENDKTLMGASKDSSLITWDIGSGKQGSVHWHETQSTTTARAPTRAAFSLELRMLGVVYRGQPIMLWDLDSNSIFGYCGKGISARVNKSGRKIKNTAVVDMLFNPAPNTSLLAAAYQDGDLVLLDPLNNLEKETVVADAQTLACSPDGRTLASGDSHGTIQIFDFETLRLMYRIKSMGHEIKSLAFSSDNLQFIDIRGFQCNVWEPSVLVRQNKDEGNSESETISSALHEVNYAEADDIVAITTVAIHPTWDILFCGKDDGTVNVYSATSGKFQAVLYKHVDDMDIVALSFEAQGSYLLSADSSSRVLAYKIGGTMQQVRCQGPSFDIHLDQPIVQLLPSTGLIYLLISSPYMDTLFTFEGKSLRKFPRAQRTSWRWAPHPAEPDQLILVNDRTIQLYHWDGLEHIKGVRDIQIDCDIPSHLGIKSIDPCSEGHHFALTFADPRGNRSSTRTIIVDTTSVHEDTVSVSPNLNYAPLHETIQHLIGTIGSRIIFLNHIGWVCSADLHGFEEVCYTRHFFVPTNWLSANTALILNITRHEDVSFVLRNEIAIVKRGFNYAEPIPFS